MASIDTRVGLYMPTVTWADLPEPAVVAHQGGAYLFPRNTREAWRGCADLTGVDAIDLDVVYSADRIGIISHDATLDADTTESGAIADRSGIGLQLVTVDAGSWFASAWGDLRLGLLSDALSDLGFKRRLSLEAKVDGQAQYLADDVLGYGVQESTLVSSAFWSEVGVLAAAGLPWVGYVMTTGTEQTPAALAAAGVTHVHIPYTAAALTSTLVSDLDAAGVKVLAYTPVRQKDAAAVLAEGVAGLMTDDPMFVRGALDDFTYLRTTDAFESGTFYHGDTTGTSGKRGVFDTTRDAWGYVETVNNGWVGRVIGGLGPIGGADGVPPSYDLTVEVLADAVVDAGRYVAVLFGVPDDRELNGSGATVAGNNYYRAIWKPSTGTIELAKITDNVAQPGGQSWDGTDAGVPSAVTLKIEVRPITVSLTRMDNGNKITLTDSSYRGGWFHLGVVGVTAYFRNLTVVEI